MPSRLWFLLALLTTAIGSAAGFALYVGVQEARLHHAGPLRQLLAEEVRPETRGHVQVLGCARHDLEVAIDSDGHVVQGERDARDRVFMALVPAEQCDDEAHPVGPGLKVAALVQGQDGAQQGLTQLYARGYVPPPTRVVVDGVIGFGAEDGWRAHHAREALAQRAPQLAQALAGAPVLVKGKRPGSPGVAYATAAVGAHGLLLIGVLLWMALRRHLRGGLPKELMLAEDE